MYEMSEMCIIVDYNSSSSLTAEQRAEKHGRIARALKMLILCVVAGRPSV